MKKIIALLLTATLVFSAGGCSKGITEEKVTDAAETTEPAGTKDLEKKNAAETTEHAETEEPEKKELSDENRILPSVLHCDDTVVNQVTEPGPEAGDYYQYRPEMLYGAWRLEDSIKYEKNTATQGMLGEKLTDVNGEEYEPEMLPLYLVFGFGNGNYNYSSGDIPLYLDTVTSGRVFYGEGPVADKKHEHIMVYDVSGDTLALGFLDTSYDDLKTGNFENINVVREQDYTIVDWNGCQLTLRYGDRQAVYVPDMDLEEVNGHYKLSFYGDYNRAGLMKGCQPLDDICYITKDQGICMNTLGPNMAHDADSTIRVPAEIMLRENGTASINFQEASDFWWRGTEYTGDIKAGDDGKMYLFCDNGSRILLADRQTIEYDAYYFSGSAITLRRENVNQVFSRLGEYYGYDLTRDPEYNVTIIPPELQEADLLKDTRFQLNGEEQAENIGYTVGELIDLGFSTEKEVSAPVKSRVVCDVFRMIKDGISFDVRAVNPYGEEIPFRDCIVCYFGFDDTTGKVTVGGSIGCGTSTREDVKTVFPDPMNEETNYLVYQTSNPVREYENDYGRFVISDNVSTCDVLFRFSDGTTLDQVIFLAPYLLYNTLADNLSGVDLGSTDPMVLEATAKVQQDILQLLQEGFRKEGISVNIDEETGKITLDNSILFGFNRWDLTNEGKAYLDSFLKVYAQVLMDGEHASAIQSVRFDGYTDTTGSYDYNLTLSQKRAQSVLDYCISGNGLTKEQVSTFRNSASAVGHSYEEPILDSSGKVDMAASRRVEIKFYLNIIE